MYSLWITSLVPRLSEKGGEEERNESLYFTNAPIYHTVTRCGIYDDIVNIDQLSGAGNALFY